MKIEMFIPAVWSWQIYGKALKPVSSVVRRGTTAIAVKKNPIDRANNFIIKNKREISLTNF